MSDIWNTYLCNVNDEPASIAFDFGMRHEAPMTSRPWLLWVWVYFQAPRPDGLSSSEEAPKLWEIEDAINLELTHSCDATPAGRITTKGRREFYLYAPSESGLQTAMAVVTSRFDKYTFEFNAKNDVNWSHYFDVLYPSEETLQTMGNRDVLEEMQKRGDLHQIPRQVLHWIYFRTMRSRKAFRKDVEKSGFTVDSQNMSLAEWKFCICVASTQPVDQESIDESVLTLFRLAKQNAGDYDGWEAQIVTQ